MKQIQHLILSNALLKLLSLVIAYACWAHFSTHREYEQEFQAPICFFGADQEYVSKAPTAIAVTLKGTRQALASVDTENIAVHIDSTTLPEGTHEKVIQSADLLLPASLKLVHYSPNNILITKG